MDTGEGDDALAAYVGRLAESKLIASPGLRASYSQIGYNLAGRTIENVIHLTYERAIASLVLEPLGLAHSLFDHDDIMTRRFAVGHNPDDDGTLDVAHPWRHFRADNPGVGLASRVADQIRWARFHPGKIASQATVESCRPGFADRFRTPNRVAPQYTGRRFGNRSVSA